jgi:hypothetical protein
MEATPSETPTEPTEAQLRVNELQNLSPGDPVTIEYGSSYSDNRQTITAEVRETEFQDSVDGLITWGTVHLDLGEEEDKIAARRRETYREGGTRKLSILIDDVCESVDLEARNGARWHSISEFNSVVVQRGVYDQ